jgi:hypothetical protein
MKNENKYEFVILYHGTNLFKTAKIILKEGFKEYTYFSENLYPAIFQGGKYVFEVLFIKNNLPNNWQVRCKNKISPDRILSLTLYKNNKKLRNNKELLKRWWNNALKFPQNDYCFTERIKIENYL